MKQTRLTFGYISCRLQKAKHNVRSGPQKGTGLILKYCVRSEEKEPCTSKLVYIRSRA